METPILRGISLTCRKLSTNPAPLAIFKSPVDISPVMDHRPIEPGFRVPAEASNGIHVFMADNPFLRSRDAILDAKILGERVINGTLTLSALTVPNPK